MNNKIKDYVKLVGTDTSGKWMSTDKVHELAELIIEDCCKEILKWKNEPFPFDEHAAVDILKRHLKSLKEETDVKVIRI